MKETLPDPNQRWVSRRIEGSCLSVNRLIVAENVNKTNKQ